MKYFFIIPIVLFSMVSSPSQSDEYMYWGWGAGSCADVIKDTADVIKDTKDNNDPSGFILKNLMTQWIMGYITGMNVKSGRRIDSNTDIDGILFELIKRCKAEPMSEIGDELYWIYKNKIK